MDTTSGLELADITRLARRAVRGVTRAARKADPPAGPGALIASHLGTDGGELPVVGEEWPGYDHVNVQGALDVWLAAEGRRHHLVGLIARNASASLSDLVHPGDKRYAKPHVGNPTLSQLPCGPAGATRSCVRCGLYLVTEPDGVPVVVLCAEGHEQTGRGAKVTVEALSTDIDLAVAVLAELRTLAVRHSVFRGEILTLSPEVFGIRRTGALAFAERPVLRRGDLVLPDGVIDIVDRQVLGVARQRDRLRASGQHLKRGLLLYGPPGTGKTHTVRYLLGQLTGVTVIVLNGNALASISAACSIARSLQPSVVVIEDVDLIADQRGYQPGNHPLLFQLLNEMDGLGEDIDVTFILTTNRADLLEPALATRPGRIDHAVEVPLPDHAARRRLLELYRGALPLEVADLDTVVERTDGVTASFLKEVLRRAALLAAEDTPATEPLDVRRTHLAAALDELLDVKARMTRTVLGG